MSEKDELNIKMITYALALENGKYYVGKTWNLNLRYAQHLAKRGAFWTQLHPPISIMEVWSGDHEKELCLSYMREFGYKHVRGWKLCKIYINEPEELLSCPSSNEIHIRNSRNDGETNLPNNVVGNEERGDGET